MCDRELGDQIAGALDDEGRMSSTGRMPVTGARSVQGVRGTWRGEGWRWRRRRACRRWARGERRRSSRRRASPLVVGADDVARGFQPPPDATVIAQYEPLTATEQQRLDALQQQIRSSLGSAEEPDWTLADSAFGRQVLRDQRVPADLVDELGELRTRGSAYTVFLQSHG